MLPCVWITPLGFPLVPDVYRIVAGSAGRTRGHALAGAASCAFTSTTAACPSATTDAVCQLRLSLEHEPGRRVSDQTTQVLDRMHGDERHDNRSGPEDTEPGGKRRGAALQTQSDPVTLLHPGFQQMMCDSRGMRGQLSVARLLSAGVHGRPLRLRLGDGLEPIGDRDVHRRHGVDGLTIAHTRSRTLGDRFSSSVTLCSTAPPPSG